jgi:hypothetical protein
VIVVDSAALIAIPRREPEADRFLRISANRMAAGSPRDSPQSCLLAFSYHNAKTVTLI